ncbi:MAG: FAD-dependent monooxygenase [Pseudomonadota bacterium]
MVRPAGRGETESLYFTNPDFDAPQIDKRDARRTTPVAIVGAGPMGMTAALALAKQGVPSVLLDNKSTFNDGSRAICVARPSFYILERIGALAPFLDKALGWTTGRTFFRGQQILEFHMPDGPNEKYRPMYNLQQQYIEAFLWQAIEAQPLIETRWQSTVRQLVDTDDGVQVSIEDPHGHYILDATWVLACDGARSPGRSLRGLRLQGENFEGRYVIADIQMDHDYPTIRRALFDPKCRPGGTVLIHKQPDNLWRIDYQLTDDESTEHALAEHTVRRSVEAVLADIGYQGTWALDWWSVYTANTLALDDYRDGRVIFVGDSAHIVPIFGVRGLNNGLAYAANIGWKLGWVIQGRAGPALLDSYSPERRGATLDVFANASKSARFMTPATKGWKLMRDAALSLAISHPFAGELANPRQMTAYTYRDSPSVGPDDDTMQAGSIAGAHVPEVALESAYLTDQLGAGFTLLCRDHALADAVASHFGDEDTLCCRVVNEPRVHETLGLDAQSTYLVRPDLHIAARWRNASADQIIACLNALLDRTEPTL